jgi:aminopyrrolnitrin oxygenase
MSAPGPELPRNWYLLGPSAALRRGRLASHEIAGRQLVVWRDQDGGDLSAMAAHCAHMGCHLGQGKVIGARLRCGLHHRMIARDGSFAGGSALRQPVYPVRAFLGGLFVHLGGDSAPDGLEALGIGGYAACYAGEHRFPVPWQWLVANGLDIEHLASVHDRQMLDPPSIEIGARELRVRYRTRPTAPKLSDRIMARLGPDGVHGSIRSVGGSMMLVESRVGAREAFILMSFVPDSAGGTVIRAISGVKAAPGVASRFAARIARALFRAFLFKDLGVLEGINWHEPAHADTLGDRYMQQVTTFFRSLESA